ncbi:MAG: hypothetical protein ACRDJ9_04155 [Dehalococcoidia bacterium]
MRRGIKLILPALILANLLLLRSGVVDVGDAFALAIIAELALLLVTGFSLFRMVHHYRSGRAAGRDTWTAAEDSLAVLLPRRAARIVVLEPRLWATLVRWVLRRTPRGESMFAYSKRSTLWMVLILVLVTAPVELLLIELLLSWAWLRVLLLILGIYGVIWLLGIWASMSVLPHQVEQTDLRLRYGLLAEAQIPYEVIRSVEQERRRWTGLRDGPHPVSEPDALAIAVGGQTAVVLRLDAPCTIERAFGRSLTASVIHVAVDDPERMAMKIQECIAAPSVASAHPREGATTCLPTSV